MGYSMEEFYADNFDFFNLIADEYKELTRQNFSKHLQGIDVETHDYVLITKKGKRLDVILSTELIDYADGKAIMGTAMDITERKHAEAVSAKTKEKQERCWMLFPISFSASTAKGPFLTTKPIKQIFITNPKKQSSAKKIGT